MDLNLASRIQFPDLNSTCDPVLSKFYTHVLDSLRGIQRTVLVYRQSMVLLIYLNVIAICGDSTRMFRALCQH